MDHNEITLDNLSKSFEFFKFCSEVDEVEDLEVLRNIAKCYCKLYLKQQEVVSNMANL
mgnify:CR=1 FL=1